MDSPSSTSVDLSSSSTAPEPRFEAASDDSSSISASITFARLVLLVPLVDLVSSAVVVSLARLDRVRRTAVAEVSASVSFSVAASSVVASASVSLSSGSDVFSTVRVRDRVLRPVVLPVDTGSVSFESTSAFSFRAVALVRRVLRTRRPVDSSAPLSAVFTDWSVSD